jgi:TolA-binding protein
MKKLLPASLTALVLALGVGSVSATEFTDDLNDLKASITALENQLTSMDVNFDSQDIESGLNRTQKLRALESKYESLQTVFSNNYVSH